MRVADISLSALLRQRRLRLLRHFLRVGPGGSVTEFVRNLGAPPCSRLAARAIRRTEVSGNLVRVWFRGYTDPLFFPRSMDIRHLQMVVCEQFFPWNWHYYQIPETTVSAGDV